MKNRIAIFMQGGIGGGSFSQGYPPLFYFVTKMSVHYDITIYSIFPANEDFVPAEFKFRTVHRKISIRRIRTVLLAFLFLWDNFRNPYTLLHAFWVYPAGTMVVLLGKVTGVPSLVTMQGGEAAAVVQIGYGNMLHPVLKKITLWTCEQTTCLNSISEFLVSEMTRHGMKRNQISVIPFGPEKSIFRKVEKQNAPLLRIVHVANLTAVKDQYTLLKAFAVILKEIPAELKIIGADFLDGKIQKFTDTLELSDHVQFIDVIPNRDLDAHYAWADIMMHTSLHEGQSGVVMEAMITGVVVCGTRVGILYDLGDEYFQTVSIGDHQALAQKVLALWRDQCHYKYLQSHAHQWVDEHDASWTINKFDELYRDITTSRT